MRNQCKCHGVSSSCDQITCWRSLPDFSEVGKQLKESYNTAIQVRQHLHHLNISFMIIRIQPLFSNFDLISFNFHTRKKFYVNE